MKESFLTFDKGLALNAPADALSDGYLRRARGMHALSLGSFRSRFGSSLLSTLNAHSIVYFNDIYHYGVGTALYRGVVSIKTSLSGNRISFSRMPPIAGIADYLFCCEGTIPFKVDSLGNVTAWGFAAPITGTLSGAVVAGGALDVGVYQYQITYYNSTTGHRSNGNAANVSVTTAGANLTVRISNIPNPAAIDAQITHVEIWRSEVDADALFYLTRIAVGIATFDDDGSITLSSEELPTDNLIPYTDFYNCLGPHNASMFWLRNATGVRGYVYYSPIGRAESVQGFIKVCGNDAPLNKLFLFQGQLGAIGEAGIYLISGTNPYIARQFSGCPGTVKPDTVIVIPSVGVMYEASDGVRLFNGSTSEIIAADITSLAFKIKVPGTIDRIFRGEAIGDLTAFSGILAMFARNEYIITDNTQSLAFDLIEKRWRDLGVGFTALFYNDETSELVGTISGDVLNFEDESSLTDNGVAIPLSVETRHISFPDDEARILQHISIDIDCASQQVTAILIHDGVETTIGVLQAPSRETKTIPIGISGRIFGIRFTGSLSARIELHRIDFYFNDIVVVASAASNEPQK